MSETRLEIPESLMPYLVASFPDDFPVDRYLITESMTFVTEEILKVQHLHDKLQKYGITSFLNSVLLYGPPGTGKTTFAEYIAFKLKLDYVWLKYSRIRTSDPYETAVRVDDIFNWAAKQKLLLLIDEIDGLARKRGMGTDADAARQDSVTNSFMQSLDAFTKGSSEALIIAATNCIDLVDDAVKSRLNPRRMDGFTIEEKYTYVTNFLKRLGIEYDDNNIREYSRKGVLSTTREISKDIERCLINYINNGEKNFRMNRFVEDEA